MFLSHLVSLHSILQIILSVGVENVRFARETRLIMSLLSAIWVQTSYESNTCEEERGKETYIKGRPPPYPISVASTFCAEGPRTKAEIPSFHH